MVRKWSYLDNYDTYDNLGDLKVRHLKRYKFKVFRTTTRFKKWNLGMFRVIPNRRPYIKRKHKTNNIYWLPIAVRWAQSYFNTRQVTRFYQLVNVLPTSILSADSELVSFRARKLDNPFGITTTSCSRNLLKLTLGTPYSNNNILNRYNPLTLGSKSSIALTTSIDDISSSNDIGLNLFYYDNNYFSMVDRVVNVSTNTLVLKNLIHYVLVIRKINIKLTLINIKR